MRIVVNCSNLVIGGGIQVAVSFLNEIRLLKTNQYLIFLSNQVNDQIDLENFDSNFQFKIISYSPACFRTRIKVVRTLNQYCSEFMPDIVFTVFGPSYWKPKNVKHLCGFAMPWMINPENPIFNKLSFFQRVKKYITSKYKWWHLRKEVDYMWCETNDVKRRILKYFDFPEDNIYSFGNTYASHFRCFVSADNKLDETFKLLTISAFYLHKNIEVIKDIIPYLESPKRFKFCLTIPQDIFDSIFSNNEKKYLINYGPVSNIDCPKLYDQCNCAFLPTFLECFSANYPEAMIMRKPILTSDLDFAHDICQDAALYFDPLDAKDIAEKIMKLASNNKLYRELQEKGLKRVKDFPSAADRARNIIELCEKIVYK